MASRPFAYNPNNESIPGTEKYGSLSIGFPESNFEDIPLKFWNGPEEVAGSIVVAFADPDGIRMGGDDTTSYVGFKSFSSPELFQQYVETIAGFTFANPADANSWVLATNKPTGTQADPFTSMEHTWTVKTSGYYHFNINGNTFSTYVLANNGWVLIASGSGSTNEASYPRTTGLTLQSDKILNAAIYNDTSISAVRIQATSGSYPLDTISTNATVLSNLRNDRSLQQDTNYDGTAWSPTTRMARTCEGNTDNLASSIYHACGLTENLHWIPGGGLEKVRHGSSEEQDLNLWVRTQQPNNATVLPGIWTNYSA